MHLDRADHGERVVDRVARGGRPGLGGCGRAKDGRAARDADGGQRTGDQSAGLTSSESLCSDFRMNAFSPYGISRRTPRTGTIVGAAVTAPHARQPQVLPRPACTPTAIRTVLAAKADSDTPAVRP